MNICYLNGELMPLTQARVPVLDRGFLFGDAVYEVIPVRRGRVFAAAEHVTRLHRSLLAIGIENPYGSNEWRSLLDRLLHENGSGIQSIYVQVSRGYASERDHVYSPGLIPTVFAMVRAGPAPDALLRVSATTAEDIRWSRCDIKSTSLLANVMLRTRAEAEGAYESILVRDGVVTEGAATNVFVVTGGRIRTPPLSNLILPGVTRGLLITVLRKAGEDVEEADIPAADLPAADEIWLTSTTRDLMSVATLDGNPVGRPGEYPAARQAWEWFQRYVAEQVADRDTDY